MCYPEHKCSVIYIIVFLLLSSYHNFSSIVIQNLVKEVNDMGTIQDLEQKIKGQGQLIKGNLESSTGHKMKGAWDKTKGKINIMAADAKLRNKENAY